MNIRMPSTEIHSARRPVPRRRLASAYETEEEALEKLKTESKIRIFVPPKDVFKNLLKVPTETQEKIIDESVEKFLTRLKSTRKPLEQLARPRQLYRSEIPHSIETACNRETARPTPRPLRKLFDNSPSYRSSQEPLRCYLNDSFICRRFEEYLVRNNEVVPPPLLNIKRNPRAARKCK